MKKFNYLYLAGIACLASCSSDEFIGEQGYLSQNGNGEISFSAKGKAVTRTTLTGSDAAAKLSNNFIVWGEKGDAPETKDEGTPVFKNYLVKYTPNTANTTASNTKDWEYVMAASAINAKYQTVANVSPNIYANSAVQPQTIKYWDYGTDHYTFTAVATAESEITSEKVKISKTIAGTTTGVDGKYEKGYTLTLAAANLDNLYLADRVEISHGTDTDPNAVNKYGGNVTFTFRQPFAKVRVGFYETIPGYSVKVNGFRVVDHASPTWNDNTTTGMWGTASKDKDNYVYTSGDNNNFRANFVNQKLGSASTASATLNVTYNSTTNEPIIADNGSTLEKNVLILGNQINQAAALGTTAAEATFDQTDKKYSYVLNKTTNTQDLWLVVDFTLTSEDGSTETIKVKRATAIVPHQYLAWKNNTAYTYLFKISDKTNGYTGNPETSGEPQGLYPITFDAMVIDTEDGLQETITSISDPSITTYAAHEYCLATPLDALYDEYKTGATVYVSAFNGENLQNFSTTAGNGKFAFYSLGTSPVTEAQVHAALNNWTGDKDLGTDITGRNNVSLTNVAGEIVASPVKAEGVDKPFAANQLVKAILSSAGYYAFVYQKGDDKSDVNHYESTGVGSETPVAISTLTGTTHYVTATNFTLLTANNATAAADKVYFKKTGANAYECVDVKVGDKVTGYYEVASTNITEIGSTTETVAGNIYLKISYKSDNTQYGVKVIKVVA